MAKDWTTVSYPHNSPGTVSHDNAVEFTPEEIENFKKDHEAYQKFRKGKAKFAMNIHLRFVLTSEQTSSWSCSQCTVPL